MVVSVFNYYRKFSGLYYIQECACMHCSPSDACGTWCFGNMWQSRPCSFYKHNVSYVNLLMSTYVKMYSSPFLKMSILLSVVTLSLRYQTGTTRPWIHIPNITGLVQEAYEETVRKSVYCGFRGKEQRGEVSSLGLTSLSHFGSWELEAVPGCLEAGRRWGKN